MNLFANIESAPRDPILGLNEAYQVDGRSNKVNLGVGVYYNDQGRVPLLAAVQKVKAELFAAQTPHTYLPIDGLANYNAAVQKLLLGENSPIIAEKRAVTIQTLGGTGALKIGADFLAKILSVKQVAISSPTWENHRAIFNVAGFHIQEYRYYDPATHGIDMVGLLADLQGLPAKSVVLFHGCCHNPTGVDLTTEDWQKIIDILKKKKLIPFIDIAYQGFGDGLEEDAIAVRLLADSGLPFIVSSSFSKSFSLYGERVGALTIVTGEADEAQRVLSQLKRLVRTNYSSPCTFGVVIVSRVLNDSELFSLWENELNGMRQRIKTMRHKLVDQLAKSGQDFSFIAKQQGMFSYSGLTAAQVNKLQTDFGIYAAASGRICAAALNESNIDYVTEAIAQVIK